MENQSDNTEIEAMKIEFAKTWGRECNWEDPDKRYLADMIRKYYGLRECGWRRSELERNGKAYGQQPYDEASMLDNKETWDVSNLVNDLINDEHVKRKAKKFKREFLIEEVVRHQQKAKS